MAIINGTAASETLLGTSGADTIKGLTGNDTITGGEGNDLAQMGAGDDMFIWRAGDGDDRLRGQDGFDTLVFEASGSTDFLTISRDVSRVLVSETLGNTLDLDDVERIWVRALAGADGIFIDDLAGTDVQQVVVDLAGVPGGKSGDGAVDGVVRNGGAGNDVLNVALLGGTVSIGGSSAQVMIRNADSDDILEIYGLGGNDAINASALPANLMRLTLDGGIGNDTITGSQGNDLLLGDDGNDVVAGGRGNDFVDLGTGNDLFGWSVGDGNDTIQGGDGIDTLLVTGTQGNNSFVFLPNIFSFTNGEFTTDGIERVRVRTLAGSDHIELWQLGVNSSLPQTDVRAIDIDLAAAVSGTLPDADSDSVSVRDDGGNEVVEVIWAGDKIVLAGLATAVSIAHAGANDQLTIIGSNDVFDASSMPAGKISLTFQVIGGVGTIFGSAGNDSVLVTNGKALAYLGAGNDFCQGGLLDDYAQMGAGNDTVKGGAGNDIAYLESGNDTFDGSDGDDTASMGDGNDFFDGGAGNDIGLLGAGNDVMNGGAGNDVARMGAGNDRYNWRAGGGSDSVDGGAGIDTFDYRAASSLTDAFMIEAETSRVRFSRTGDVIRLTSVERLQVMAGWGVDFITVKDLAGTGMELVAIDLAASVGSVVGDGSSDIVTLEGTAGSDLITVGNFAGGLSVTGLAAQVTITHADNSGLPTDILTISGGEGNDTINASAMPDVLVTQFNGGNGNDSIVGGACTDTLAGGDGNDTLSGGANLDALFGDAGNDRLLGGASRDQLSGGADNDFLDGGLGNDTLDGGLGNDVLVGGRGNDQITCGDGADRVKYTSVLDGHDVILDFDGDPTGGQDVLDLDALFDSLGIAASKRAGLVNINDLGNTVEISVNVDGKAGFELLIATLNTVDVIIKGQDVIVGT